MLYKVFLVEDEIVTREGIRDNVAWQAAGFEFCGEAPDGEVALPLIENAQPELLITDIKMPFMDGLQLCRLVRERMPWVKILILSGHDEFGYAQSAIQLGVSEYLLKPITAVEIQNVLQRLAALLDQERDEREKRKQLQRQINDNLILQRERLLLQLVVGGASSAEAIEQCRRLGLDIIAPCYLVTIIKLYVDKAVGYLDYPAYQQAQNIVSNLIESHPGAFLAQKSAEELLLVMSGEDVQQLEQDGLFLGALIQKEVEAGIGCQVSVGIGAPQQRLTHISHSFMEALAKVKEAEAGTRPEDIGHAFAPVGMPRLEQTAVEHYLKCGLIKEFDTFFAIHLQPMSIAALQSYLIKHYLLVDIILTTAQFITDLGGDAAAVIPEIQNIEKLLLAAKTGEQMQATIKKIFLGALAFRNKQATYERTRIIHQVKTFIDNHFADPDLLLNAVAARANLSPGHFSVLFSHEVGETFKDYLTRIRIERAKELLRTTNLKCAEIALRSGYNDPHYFSHVFRKNTGLPPQQFRQQF